MFRKNEQPQQLGRECKRNLGRVLHDLLMSGVIRTLEKLQMKVLFVYVVRADNDDCTAWPGLDSICREVGVTSRKRVRDARNVLVERGILEGEIGGGGRGNTPRFRLTCPAWEPDAPGLFEGGDAASEMRVQSRIREPDGYLSRPATRDARGRLLGKKTGSVTEPPLDAKRGSVTEPLYSPELGKQTGSAVRERGIGGVPERAIGDRTPNLSAAEPLINLSAAEHPPAPTEPPEPAAAKSAGEENAAAAQTAQRCKVIDELAQLRGEPPGFEPMSRRDAHELSEHIDLRTLRALKEGIRIRKPGNQIGFAKSFIFPLGRPRNRIPAVWYQTADKLLGVREAKQIIDKSRDHVAEAIAFAQDARNRKENQQLERWAAEFPTEFEAARLLVIEEMQQFARAKGGHFTQIALLWSQRTLADLLANKSTDMRARMLQVRREVSA